MIKTMGVLAAVLVVAAGVLFGMEARGVDVCCTTKEAAVSAESGENSAPMVCTLTDPEKRARRGDVGKLLSSYARDAKELGNGFSIAFENGHGKEIVEFVELERECCAFFNFTMNFPAGDQPTTLTITGPEGSKEFLRDTIASWSTTKKSAANGD